VSKVSSGERIVGVGVLRAEEKLEHVCGDAAKRNVLRLSRAFFSAPVKIRT
jgi:hypothetical protein